MKKKSHDKKRLVLLDVHAILHRAYHALPDFSSSKGEPTGGLYGLAAMLLKIVGDLKPDYIVACYDLPAPTYRHEAYEAYKAGRHKIDENLVAQINRSSDLFDAFGIPRYSLAGFEADDMLGTIVEKLEGNNSVDIVIASGDMDTLQLVDDERVRVYTLKKGIKDTVIYDEKSVIERFGFGPELLPDYKGLRGDPSDNIVGIPGIGEKTATELITNFGTIENIYKKLMSDAGAFSKAGIKPRIVELLKEHEEEALFSKMLATIRRDAPIDWKFPEKTWKENCELGKVKDFFAELEFRTLGQRVETLLNGEGAKPGSEDGPKLTQAVAGQGEVIDHTKLEEAKLMLQLVDSNIGLLSLDDILRFAKAKTFRDAYDTLRSEIDKRGLGYVYEEIERPLTPIIRKMEERGVCVDKDYLEKLSKEYHKELSKLESAIWGDAGGEFNINSPKQLGEVLFEKLGLKARGQKKTATGAMSTKESELEKIKDLHPIVARILEYREYQKLLSTYIDNIPSMLTDEGRLHAHFEQIGAATGRMSSSDPNLQNIPVKTELGRKIRGAFVAAEGHSLVAFDYSQIELRIAAILSGDEKLIDIFKRGEDVHAAVAARVFGVSMIDVTKEMRSRAKVINFGILYGMGVNALKQNLGTDRKEAQDFYNQYFDTFTTLAAYLETTKAEAAKQGFTTTLFGRRRYFDGIRSPLPYIRAAAERMAINAPIQGTQADLIKLAMRRIDEHLAKAGCETRAHLILQVHDEVIYEIEKELVPKLAGEIRSIMESALGPEQARGVPILANASAGERWSHLEKIS